MLRAIPKLSLPTEALSRFLIIEVVQLGRLSANANGVQLLFSWKCQVTVFAATAAAAAAAAGNGAGRSKAGAAFNVSVKAKP